MDAIATDRHLQRVIKISFSLLILFLPLLLSTRSSEVFELPKMLFVYAMTAAIVGLWLGRMAVRREILIRRTPLDIPILLFLISQMASTIYSIDPAVSWWGWYGRFHGGLISTISYTLLYYALISNFSGSYKGSVGRTVKLYNGKTVVGKSVRQHTILPFYRSTDYRFTVSPFHRLLIKVILSSALVVSIYAILQHFGVDRNFWVQDVVNRVFSTQGQPNWLAGYLVMAMPLGWAMAIAKEEGRRKKEEGLGMTAFYLLPFTFYLALLWTKSRSGLLGLAVADLVFWLLIFFQFYLLKKRSCIDQQRSLRQQPTFSGTKKLYRLSTIVNNLYNFNKNTTTSPVAVFFLIHSILVILVVITNNPVREFLFSKINKSTAQQSAINNQQLTITPAMETGITLRKPEHGGTESGDIRRIVWNGAIQLVKQRPVFGFGPETFGETYWRVRPKEHNLTSEWNFLYNKAHNEWLNLAANTGIFGLGSHLLLLIWFSVWAMRSFANFSRDEKFAKLNYLAAILAGLIGVEAVNFFGFSTVTIGTYRYLFMAAAVSAAGNTNKLLKTLSDRQGSSVINIVSKLLKPIADRAMTSVIQDRDRDENLRKNTDLRQKFILAGLSALILYLISQVSIFFLADLAYNRGRAYQDGGYIEEAVEPLMQAVNLVPAEPVFRVELGEAEGMMASQVQSSKFKVQSEDQTLINELRNEAIKNLEIVRRQSPYNLGFVRTEARVLFSLGEEERALQLMKLAMEMAPTNPQLPYSLGQMLSKIGKEEEAAVYYNKAVELKPDYSVSPPSSDPVTLTPSSLR